jgi:type IV pilus assembly protein PilY1
LRNTNGVIHRLYVGDTGGTVWRVDLPPGTEANHRRDNWFITRLAVLGEDGATTDRRFFHKPDVVETKDSFGDYDGIVISSGNRADPNETAVENYHFYIKDRLISSGADTVKTRDASPLTLADLADQSDCGVADDDSCALPSALANGWRIRLQRSGEKGLATGLVDGGRVFMTSFVPASAVASCAPTEGTGKLYVVDLATGSNQVVYDLGPGIPPNVIAIGNMLYPPSRPDADPNSPSDPNEVGCEGQFCESKTERLVPIYWREPGIDPL